MQDIFLQHLNEKTQEIMQLKKVNKDLIDKLNQKEKELVLI